MSGSICRAWKNQICSRRLSAMARFLERRSPWAKHAPSASIWKPEGFPEMRGQWRQSPHSPLLVALLTLLFVQSSHAQTGACVIPGRGYFRIHVGAGGLFGAFAHDHHIEAQKVQGCAIVEAKDLTHSSIKLVF